MGSSKTLRVSTPGAPNRGFAQSPSRTATRPWANRMAFAATRACVFLPDPRPPETHTTLGLPSDRRPVVDATTSEMVAWRSSGKRVLPSRRTSVARQAVSRETERECAFAFGGFLREILQCAFRSDRCRGFKRRARNRLRAVSADGDVASRRLASTIARRLGIPSQDGVSRPCPSGSPLFDPPAPDGRRRAHPGFSAREYAERRGRLAEKLRPTPWRSSRLPPRTCRTRSSRTPRTGRTPTSRTSRACSSRPVAMVARDRTRVRVRASRAQRGRTWNGARLARTPRSTISARTSSSADPNDPRDSETARRPDRSSPRARRATFVAAASGTAGAASSRLTAHETRSAAPAARARAAVAQVARGDKRDAFKREADIAASTPPCASPRPASPSATAAEHERR